MGKKRLRRKVKALSLDLQALERANARLWAELQEWRSGWWRGLDPYAFGQPVPEPEERVIAVDEVCQICGAKDCLAGDLYMVGQVSFRQGHLRPDGDWCYGVNGYFEPEERVCRGIAWSLCHRPGILDTGTTPCATMAGCVGRAWFWVCQHEAEPYLPRHTHPCGVMS